MFTSKCLGSIWRSRSSSAAKVGSDSMASGSSDSTSLCPSQSPSVLDGMCTEDADCPMGNPVVHGNGTGCFAKETKF